MVINVLLVDDTEETTTTLEMMYESNSHFRVIGKAYNAQQAIDFITANQVDFASIDFQLGKDDGIELCKQIRKLSPSTFIIMCTVMGDEATRNRAREVGIHYFVGKPMALKELNTLYTAYMSFTQRDKQMPSDELPDELSFLTEVLGEK